MTRDEIKNGLQDIIRGIFDNEKITLTESMPFSDIAEWDSLNHINIVFSSEKRFRVRLAAKEAAALKNVGAFIDLVQSKLGNA